MLRLVLLGATGTRHAVGIKGDHDARRASRPRPLASRPSAQPEGQTGPRGGRSPPRRDGRGPRARAESWHAPRLAVIRPAGGDPAGRPPAAAAQPRPRPALRVPPGRGGPLHEPGDGHAARRPRPALLPQPLRLHVCRPRGGAGRAGGRPPDRGARRGERVPGRPVGRLPHRTRARGGPVPRWRGGRVRRGPAAVGRVRGAGGGRGARVRLPAGRLLAPGADRRRGDAPGRDRRVRGGDGARARAPSPLPAVRRGLRARRVLQVHGRAARGPAAPGRRLRSAPPCGDRAEARRGGGGRGRGLHGAQPLLRPARGRGGRPAADAERHRGPPEARPAPGRRARLLPRLADLGPRLGRDAGRGARGRVGAPAPAGPGPRARPVPGAAVPVPEHGGPPLRPLAASGLSGAGPARGSRRRAPRANRHAAARRPRGARRGADGRGPRPAARRRPADGGPARAPRHADAGLALPRRAAAPGHAGRRRAGHPLARPAPVARARLRHAASPPRRGDGRGALRARARSGPHRPLPPDGALLRGHRRERPRAHPLVASEGRAGLLPAPRARVPGGLPRPPGPPGRAAARVRPRQDAVAALPERAAPPRARGGGPSSAPVPAGAGAGRSAARADLGGRARLGGRPATTRGRHMAGPAHVV